MKYDRIQESFRYITPGLFFLAVILCLEFDTIRKYESVSDTISKLSTIIVVLLPFVGFVLGFFIECLMTWFERALYGIGVARPSRKVLHGSSNLYLLDDQIRMAILKGEQVNDNRTSNRYQQAAKQHVGENPLVSRFYFQSIMARHIFGALLLACVYYLAFSGGWSWLNLICSLITLAILALFWYHGSPANFRGGAIRRACIV